MGWNEDNCFQFFGRNFLIGVNLLSAVLGLLLCGGGAYLYVEYDNQFSELLSPAPILGVMISGFILFLLTMVGVYGAVTGKRTVLIVYVVVVVILIAVEVAAAVVFLQYLDVIESSADAEASSDSTEIAINDLILSSYHTCCVVSDKAFCDVIPVCTNVFLCSEPLATDACIANEESDKLVDIGVCTAFEKFTIDGTALVGLVVPGNDITCGGGDPGNFQAAVTEWLRGNINFFGYGAIGVGSLQVLIVAFSFALIFSRPELIPQAAEIDEEDGHMGVYVEAEPVRVSKRFSVDSRQSSRNSAQRVSVQRHSAQRNSIRASVERSLSAQRSSIQRDPSVASSAYSGSDQ